ncbi:hypothetical protein J3U75_06670 [Snodgrassella sp. B3088]|uniref:hypothetical protein n=1 Tax=Snodgrassella sp. B3088 TaxID=2818038 RepID=UPI002269D80F|nr:hypothetical protein [Snodgrassella sp. B3088]MCX8749065.1 hypothetical protein [Snodgrassella sp. B3088]
MLINRCIQAFFFIGEGTRGVGAHSNPTLLPPYRDNNLMLLSHLGTIMAWHTQHHDRAGTA